MIRIAVNDREPGRDRLGHLRHVNFNAARIGTFFARQIFNQRAIAAANIKHARIMGNHLRNQAKIKAHILRDILHAIHGDDLNPKAFGATGEETAKRAMEIRFFQQEGVMALVAVNLNETDIGCGHVQRAHQGAAFAGGE